MTDLWSFRRPEASDDLAAGRNSSLGRASIGLLVAKHTHRLDPHGPQRGKQAGGKGNRAQH